MSKPGWIGECSNCVWWESDDPKLTKPLPENHGECHVAPPVMDAHGSLVSVYPVTRGDCWCKVWQRKWT